MGAYSVKAIESLRERKDFLYHLLNDIEALEMMIDGDVFEKGIQRIGAEQELCLVDKNFRPSSKALQVLRKINDQHFTTELALFTLEINLDPLDLYDVRTAPLVEYYRAKGCTLISLRVDAGSTAEDLYAQVVPLVS